MLTFRREDCHLVDEVRRHHRQLTRTRSTNWRVIAAHRAAQLGQFIVWRCDDTMVVYTREPDGKISARSHKPGTWRFDKPL